MVGGNFEPESFRGIDVIRTPPQPLTGDGGFTGNVNSVMPLTNGSSYLAMANLNIDAQLSDGIRVSLTTYLSSRHHAGRLGKRRLYPVRQVAVPA